MIARTKQPAFPMWLLPILALIVLSGPMLAALRTPNGRVKTGTHATDKHGSEAAMIRQQLSRCRPDETWRLHKDRNIECWLCELPTGKWGIMLVQWWNSLNDECRWRELTSFAPRDGTYKRVIDYLAKIAERIQ